MLHRFAVSSAAVEEADRLERRKQKQDGKIFAALIGAFRESRHYEKLAPSSLKDYDRHLNSISELWGDLEVRHLRARNAQVAIDAYSDRPNAGRYFRAVLSRLIEFGIPREFCGTNVIAATHKPEHEQEPFPPWPDWAFEVFLTCARPGLHMAMHSAIYTGQRSVDVIPMARPSRTARAIELISRKTGAEVFVPIHPEYRALIDAEASDHPALHLREDGEPWTLAGFRTAWQREFTFKAEPDDGPEAREEAAMRRLREANVVSHGLRKNTVCVLLEVGCTEAEVASLVQMSEQMVRHYGRGVNRRRLAESAMKKLETSWGSARGSLFGRSRTEAP